LVRSPDQAEGLRRLFVQDVLRVVTITSGHPGTGRTTTVISLANALADKGKNVLVIDENIGACNIAGTLGFRAHRDLLDVIRRDRALEEVLIATPSGFSVLQTGQGMRVLDRLNAGDQEHLLNAFANIGGSVDVVLIDGGHGRNGHSLPLIAPGHEIVVLVSPDPNSITAAYALIKHASVQVRNQETQEKQHFRILVNKAASQVEARTIFENMERAAGQYLDVSLDFTGFIPLDNKLCLSGAARPAQPVARAEAAFRQVAESLIHWPGQKSAGNRLDQFMQHVLRSAKTPPNHTSSVIAAVAR
jgi:flagellar biosynthesis protein FlhG